MSNSAAFELGWNVESTSLIIGFDPDSFESQGDKVVAFARRYLPEKTRELAGIEGDFVLPNGSEPWGYGGSLKPTNLHTGLSLPSHSVDLRAVFWGGAYNGLKVLLHQVCSLAVLFEALRYPEDFGAVNSAGPPKIAELYGFGLEVGRIYGSTIHGTLYQPALEYINSKASTGVVRLGNVEGAMTLAHQALHPDDDGEYLGGVIRAHIGRNEFHLTVPGNACGLDPIDNPSTEPGTIRLCPHNTDRPTQQLTLAVGVAALCDAVREYEATRLA